MVEDRAKQALLRLKNTPKSYSFKDLNELLEESTAKRAEVQKSEEEILKEIMAAQQRIERIMHQMDDAVRGGSGTSSGYLNYYWTIKDLEKKFLEEIKILETYGRDYLKPQFLARVSIRKEKILQRQKKEQERMQGARR